MFSFWNENVVMQKMYCACQNINVCLMTFKELRNSHVCINVWRVTITIIFAIVFSQLTLLNICHCNLFSVGGQFNVTHAKLTV